MSLDAMYYAPLAVSVAEEDAGKTVRAVLDRRLGVSRKLLSRLKLTEHGITVNGVRVYTNDRVAAGDLLELRMEREESDDILPEPMALDIVYEDDDLFVVNKPPGVIVHPTHGHYTGTLANGVVHHWRERGERVRFRPIHRLDEDTSGLVAIAKTAYVHQQLSEQLQRGEVDKRYRAYVYGRPAEAAAAIDEPIDRDEADPHLRVVRPDGYPSVTRYETEAVFGGGAAAKVNLKLETGRTHQIRVHMKHIGCPLIGDKLYGYAGRAADEAEGEADSAREAGDSAVPAAARAASAEAPSSAAVLESAIERQALHAAMLAFTHPITRERMSFEASLPDDLRRLEAALERL
ncbi:RluA family pseudouridine synthase [Paenibacillus sp. MWE-103]|uniref:Pseudouridine synthase n=1 Tax=Paenibacillus artemisiicola TaxID=1172618 RepID=A0ABS3W9B4_9BACL|nr:RluA family pseudouridine synthase [Paenibacillus artemisiicola]MBO7744700.1 RluA family pseudouridine synthase [Paenibacillus artemisiicola]